jgi:hypothetical protein
MGIKNKNNENKNIFNIFILYNMPSYKPNDATTIYLTNSELHDSDNSSILDILEQNIANNPSLVNVVFIDDTLSEMQNILNCISIQNELPITINRNISTVENINNITQNLLNWRPMVVTSNNVKSLITNHAALNKFVNAVNN